MECQVHGFSECFTATCGNRVVFSQTITAQDKDTLAWGAAEDVRWAKGDLVVVSTYTALDDGALLASTSLDISADMPAAGDGFYYVVMPLGCGSWQTSAGAEPGRDAGLP